jgi:hypothetical protein
MATGGTSELDIDPRCGFDDADAGASRSREASWLVGLALGGLAIEVIAGLTGLNFFARYRMTQPPPVWLSAIRVLALALMTAIVPVAVKRNQGLGLPGSPWLRDWLGTRRPMRDLRRLIKPALKFGLLYALAALALAFAGTHFHFVRHPPPIRLPIHPTVFEVLTLLLLGMMEAFGAAISEEIIFRVGFVALLASWIGRRWHDEWGRPAETAMWLAIASQAYLFGLIHILPGGVASRLYRGYSPIVAFFLPQTWAGFFLGIIYRREGLEASLLAHAFMDIIEPFLAGFVIGIEVAIIRARHH